MATMCGLERSLLDMQYSDDLEKKMKLNPNYRDPVVLGICTSELGDIEIDPNTRKYENIWYIHKGDVKLEHLFFYGYVPFSVFDSNRINQIMKFNEMMTQQMQQMESSMNMPQSVTKQLSYIEIPKVGIK